MRDKLKNDLLLALNNYVDSETLRGIDQRLNIMLSDYEIEKRKTEVITYEYQIRISVNDVLI